MADIRFPGLASGIDTNAIVQALVNVERQPINKLQSQRVQLENRRKSISDISSLLSDLKRVSERIDTMDELVSYKATSSLESVSVSAGVGSMKSNHTVKIQALAAAQRTYSKGFSSDTDTGLLGDGSLSIAVGDEDPFVMDIDANTSLNDVVEAINAGGKSLAASVVYDGENYFLNISGTETGSSKSIVFSEVGTLFDFSNPSRTVQAAQDAEALVDGLLIRRSTNVFSDVIAGVSFEAKEVSDKTATLSIAEDAEATRAKINEFVDAYNKVQKKIADQASVLSGDSTIRRLKSSLTSLVTSSVSPLSDGYASMGSLGIRTQADGTLKVDESTYSKAVKKGLSSVLKLWTEDTSTARKGIAKSMEDLVQAYTISSTGDLSLKVSSYASQVRKIDQNIESLTRRVDAFEARMLTRFSNLEREMNASLATSSYLASTTSSKG